MPKINVSKPILDFNGEPIQKTEPFELCEACKQKKSDKTTDFLLREICTRSLSAMTDKTSKLSGQQKFERGRLAMKIHNEDEPHLSAEEISLIKEAIGDVESVLVVMRAYEILDPQEDDKKSDK